MMTWPIINSRLRTAQKTPAGWLGTVVALNGGVERGIKGNQLRHSLNVIAVHEIIGGRVASIALPCRLEAVDTFDIMHQGDNTASEEQHKRYNAERANCVETEEADCGQPISEGSRI